MSCRGPVVRNALQTEVDRLNEHLAQGSVLHAAREQAMKELEHRLQVQGEYLNQRLNDSERVADREVGRRQEFQESNLILESERQKQQHQMNGMNERMGVMQAGTKGCYA